MDDMAEQDSQELEGDPRIALAQWVNNSDEWIRSIVRQVLGSSDQISEAELAQIYQLLKEEKGIDDRVLSTQPPIAEPTQALGQSEPLFLTRISNIKGVNALTEGEHIDFGKGLTLLFGENGTGKTGYARILKRVADSRSVEDILADVNLDGVPPSPSADIDYRSGDTDFSYQWNGEEAQPPLDLMSIFDNPAAYYHVDSDLRYTYRPAALAIFDRVNHEVQGIIELIEQEIQDLPFNNSALLSRIDAASSIYPYIQSLGPTTDMKELLQLSIVPEHADDLKEGLETAVAGIRANLVGQQISLKSRLQNALKEALDYTEIVAEFEVQDYQSSLTKLSELHSDQTTLRDSLFAAANLPAEPDQTWEAFIKSGKEYHNHLQKLGVHDETRCLYCRQTLSPDGLSLIAKYSNYLESQIAKDIRAQESTIQALVKPLQDSSLANVLAFCRPAEAKPDEGIAATTDQIETLRELLAVEATVRKQLADKTAVEESNLSRVSEVGSKVGAWHSDATAALEELRIQNTDREEVLTKKEAELLELRARMELNKSWSEVEGLVAIAIRREKLRKERDAIAVLRRSITILSNKASELLINKNFEHIFRNECAELRAPGLELEFFGRQGEALRRKKMPGGTDPSKVLSEGEQKVIALADFMAEARMSDNTVPVIFDDPVSSLDHRRVGEVAKRIADLASDHQVVVFTHDILFVNHLLSLLEKSEKHVFYWVTDDNGTGTVTPAAGYRWDSISALNDRLSSAIDKARKSTGEERDSHVRQGYALIRAWCEVFVEHDVLAEVTERYQPNVRIGALKGIKTSKLEQTIATVTSVFNDACRYIDAHSQPLATLGILPKLSDLKSDWGKLRVCRSEYNKN